MIFSPIQSHPFSLFFNPCLPPQIAIAMKVPSRTIVSLLILLCAILAAPASTLALGLTPDEKEIWLADGHNMRMHVFSTTLPYTQLTTIPVHDMPGWITFSLDGKYAYPSSGEVIDVKTRKVLTTLQDENYNTVSSEKMVEVHFTGNKLSAAGDQFGVGRVK